MSPTRQPYPSLDELDAFVSDLATRLSEWVEVVEIGRSLQGRSIGLVTLGRRDGGRDHRPAFWLDAGTHCAEWAGVSAAVDAMERWTQGLSDGGEMADWLSEHTIHVVPCISPDGYAAMLAGAPYTRSTLRPPPKGALRVGWSPQDMDGDSVVRLLRWRHPAGAFVVDEDEPLHMRMRRLQDDPDDAFFVAEEGQFVNWDGTRWTGAPREFGLDLNRNFPGSWRPFSMFGMDAGAFPGSAPEARAVLDALHARPQVSAAITLHTFTGALLTAPYRANGPLSEADQMLMGALAEDAVEGTGYDAIAVHPNFTYDPKNPIGGVWADTLATVFGVAGFTLEIWDPFGPAGVKPESVARFFRSPEPEVLLGLVRHYADQPGTRPWTAFDHPQLGAVEIGGLELQRTVRNPPEAALPAELDRVFTIVDRARRALPQVRCRCVARSLGSENIELQVIFENAGFLNTGGLAHAETVARVPGLRMEVVDVNGVVVDVRDVGHLDGWGATRVGAGAMPLMPGLPKRGHRAVETVVVTGQGPWTVRWQSTRSGRGAVVVTP